MTTSEKVISDGLSPDRGCAVADQIGDGELNLTVSYPAVETGIHPGSASFVFGTGVGIEIESGDLFSRCVEDLVEADIGIPDGDFVFGFLDRHIEQAVG